MSGQRIGVAQRKSRLAGTDVPTANASTRSAVRLTVPCPNWSRPRMRSTGEWRATGFQRAQAPREKTTFT